MMEGELRADSIERHDVFREYGMEDPVKVRKVRMHGDTVLIWGDTLEMDDNDKIIGRSPTETSLDRDDVVELIHRKENER